MSQQSPQWDRTPPNPWGRRFSVANRPDIPPPVRQALADLARGIDTQEVWAPPGIDLARVANVAGVKTIRLYANTTYYTTNCVLNRAVEIVGPRSAVVAPLPNATGTMKITLQELFSGKAGDLEPIILRGFTSYLPIECLSRAELTDLAVMTQRTTTNGAKIEVNAPRCLVRDCYSDNADAIGIYAVETVAAGSRILGNDFSLHTTAVEGWAADALHLGSDTNAGVIVLH